LRLRAGGLPELRYARGPRRPAATRPRTYRSGARRSRRLREIAQKAPPLPSVKPSFPTEPPWSAGLAELSGLWLSVSCKCAAHTGLPLRYLAAAHGWKMPLSKRLQIDEIWGFVGSKAKNTSQEAKSPEPLATLGYGSQPTPTRRLFRAGTSGLATVAPRWLSTISLRASPIAFR
jgi:hypothetical protein